MSSYGDFEEVKTETETKKQPNKNQQPEQNIPVRVRFPREKQFIGIVLQRLGGNRMSIKTTDNKVRNCRVPGRFSRKFWLRPGNFVIIEPWSDNDDKGDVVYQYNPPEANQLKKRGMVSNLQNEF